MDLLTGRTMLNETHDPELRSWVQSANTPAGDFPIQNLPFSVFHRAGSTEAFRGGVAIGDQILDLAAALRAAVWESGISNILEAAARPTLNQLMARGPQEWSALRLALSRALCKGSELESALQPCLVPQSQAQYALPASICDYTDFYISVHHATAVATTISPWVVTLEALAPFRAAWRRPAADPKPLPYLDAPHLRTTGAIDIQLEVHLQSEGMRRAGHPACRLSCTSFRHAYWTIA